MRGTNVTTIVIIQCPFNAFDQHTLEQRARRLGSTACLPHHCVFSLPLATLFESLQAIPFVRESAIAPTPSSESLYCHARFAPLVCCRSSQALEPGRLCRPRPSPQERSHLRLHPAIRSASTANVGTACEHSLAFSYL